MNKDTLDSIVSEIDILLEETKQLMRTPSNLPPGYTYQELEPQEELDETQDDGTCSCVECGVPVHNYETKCNTCSEGANA